MIKSKYIRNILENSDTVIKETMDLNLVLNHRSNNMEVSKIENSSILECIENDLCKIKLASENLPKSKDFKCPEIEPTGLQVTVNDIDHILQTDVINSIYDQISEDCKAVKESENHNGVYDIVKRTKDDPKSKSVILDKCGDSKTKIKKSISKKDVKEAAEYVDLFTNTISLLIEETDKLKKDNTAKRIKFNKTIDVLEKKATNDVSDILNILVDKSEFYLKEDAAYIYISEKLDQTICKFIDSCSILQAASIYDPMDIDNSMAELEFTDTICNNIKECLESALNSDLDDMYEEKAVNEALEKVKSKLVVSNEKLLNKYEDAALKSSCSGIVIKTWYKPVDLDKKYKNVQNDIEKNFKTATADSYNTLKKRYNKLSGSFLLGGADGEAEKISDKMINNKSVTTFKKEAFEEEEDHQVTKSDVKFAVNFLKNAHNEITKAKQKQTEASQNIQIHNTDRIGVNVGSKSERLNTKILSLKAATSAKAENLYWTMKLKQLKVLQNQCRVVIMKAARVTDTKVNEALIKLCDYDDSILENFSS